MEALGYGSGMRAYFGIHSVSSSIVIRIVMFICKEMYTFGNMFVPCFWNRRVMDVIHPLLSGVHQEWTFNPWSSNVRRYVVAS